MRHGLELCSWHLWITGRKAVLLVTTQCSKWLVDPMNREKLPYISTWYLKFKPNYFEQMSCWVHHLSFKFLFLIHKKTIRPNDRDEMNQISGPPEVLKRPKTRLDRCAWPRSKVNQSRLIEDRGFCLLAGVNVTGNVFVILSRYSISSYHLFTTNDPSPWHHESQCNNLHVMQSLSVGSTSSKQAANFTSTSAKAASGISSKTCLEQVEDHWHVFLGQHHGLLDSFQSLCHLKWSFMVHLLRCSSLGYDIKHH